MDLFYLLVVLWLEKTLVQNRPISRNAKRCILLVDGMMSEDVGSMVGQRLTTLTHHWTSVFALRRDIPVSSAWLNSSCSNGCRLNTPDFEALTLILIKHQILGYSTWQFHLHPHLNYWHDEVPTWRSMASDQLMSVLSTCIFIYCNNDW